MESQGQTLRYRTANPYEQSLGYSRAIRRGNYIFVSGTTALDPNTGIITPGSSAYDQAVTTFAQICTAVEALGGRREDVMRVRMYVTEHEDFEDVARAYRETFGDHKPALTGLVGIRFVSPDMKVEIEADAVVA
ncbi:YjgF-like protein [Cristinia sonorae]|uniref:YjgF-like protein n=1 Tax=Cristinia sonorae TaxID=1940300 RepID=A0A8K0UES0_9AGAR|nr:YjgF-like protein [Cristinia sonorae]